jgi:hypothetical protein
MGLCTRAKTDHPGRGGARRLQRTRLDREMVRRDKGSFSDLQ